MTLGRPDQVETFGNVLVAIAFLEGLATEELKKDELDSRDEDYELLIEVRAKSCGRGDLHPLAASLE